MGDYARLELIRPTVGGGFSNAYAGHVYTDTVSVADV